MPNDVPYFFLKPRRCLAMVPALLLMFGIICGAMAQGGGPKTHSIAGTVVDAGGIAQASAIVSVRAGTANDERQTRADAQGKFAFGQVADGEYVLSAASAGVRGSLPVSVAGTDRVQIRLVLSRGAERAMQFSDQPNFTVAGVTDWTAVGGHGSDVNLRTSEELARETLTLKAAQRPSGPSAGDEKKLREVLQSHPQSYEANHQLGELYTTQGRYAEGIPLLEAAGSIEPDNSQNAYLLAAALSKAGQLAQAREKVRVALARRETADLDRLAGELDEAAGDPLASVREEAMAVSLDASEQNYFAWGSELLLHRAVLQAVDVFTKGSQAHPSSSRMLAALGTALFASARYDEAAARLCAAADLAPAEPEPYMFMGRLDLAAPDPLPCVQQKLAAFAAAEPPNAYARYLYAMAIQKRESQPLPAGTAQKVEGLLTEAVALDPKCHEAYLQLGILAFRRRDYAVAAQQYEKAIAIDPHAGEAHFRLAMAYDRLGKQAEARQQFALHGAIEKEQAAAVEAQRRELKQFLIVLQAQPSAGAVQ